MIHKGSCHCGRIAFEAEGEIENVISCNCSHCQRKGYLLWFLPRAAVKLLTPEAEMATYTFNKHVIRHHFCPVCGCAPFGFGTAPDGSPTAAINVRCLEDNDLSKLTVMPYDGKSA
ncbi:MAG: GFA family protein [Alphaproteobacteria bacterium]|nr:GFA family protein [Alphaproteobacteria bacterium]